MQDNTLYNLLEAAVLCDVSYNIDHDMMYTPVDICEHIVFSSINKYISAYRDAETDTNYIIAYSNDLTKIYIAIRGTQSIKDFKQDVAFGFESVDDQIKFHKGFYRCARVIIKLLNGPCKDARLILCGHSMGGSIAAILAYILAVEKYAEIHDISVYTFGAPIFTNHAGVDWYKANIRKYYHVINMRDPIPGISHARFAHMDPIQLDEGIISINPVKKSNLLLNLLWRRMDLRHHSIKKYISILNRFCRI